MKPCVKISLNLKAEFKALAQMFSHEKSENLSKSDRNLSTKSKNLNLNSINSSQNLALYELYQIFHAQIIAFGKAYFKGKTLNDNGKRLLQRLA